MNTKNTNRDSEREAAAMGHDRLEPQSREDFQLWDRIGDAYWRETRRDEARRAWERARALRPGSPRIKRKLTAADTGRDPLALPA